MKHKKKLFLITLLLILPLLGAIYWQFSAQKNTLSDGEKSKAYKELLGRDIKEARTIEIKDYKGQTFALKYPSNFSIKEATSSTAQKSETLRLISFEPRLNMTVMSVDATSTNLSDYSAVKFRAENSEQYKKTDSEINNQKALVFEKLGSESEKTIFTKKGNTIYSLSITGNNREEAEKLFAQVLQTLNI